MVIDPWELYEEIQNKDKCKSCDRTVIDNMRTKGGCIWCDIKYHNSKKTIAIKKIEDLQNVKR